MDIILRVLASAFLVLFGLGMFWFGIHSVKQRARMESAYRGTDMEEQALRCLRSMPWMSLLLGLSFFAASVFIWVNPILSVVIVALPFIVRFVSKPGAKRI